MNDYQRGNVLANQRRYEEAIDAFIAHAGQVPVAGPLFFLIFVTPLVLSRQPIRQSAESSSKYAVAPDANRPPSNFALHRQEPRHWCGGCYSSACGSCSRALGR